MIGKTLVHYEITTLLGRGGMGEVYQAKDQKLSWDLAIKILPGFIDAVECEVNIPEIDKGSIGLLQSINAASFSCPPHDTGRDIWNLLTI